MRPNNPFLIAGYHSPEYFCDREMETATIIDALHNGRNVTLIAPRRMGKTGLVRHCFYKLKEKQPEIVTLYMDIYSTQSLGDFVRMFANIVLGKLVTVDIAPEEETNTLKEIFDYFGSSDKRCYIAIDEFQQIAEYPEKGVEALLRSYIQFLPNVNFIFAGSRQHIMQEMFASSKRPFYQSTQLINVGPIDREEYARFARAYFEKRGKLLPHDVFDAIYDKYDGHTWYIQNILNRLYGYDMDVNMEMVAYATGQIIDELSYSYAALLKAYSPGHVRLLKSIAQEGVVKEILAGDFITRHRLRAASSVSAALKKLLDNELVYQTQAGYIVYDRFMGEWLRNLR